MSDNDHDEDDGFYEDLQTLLDSVPGLDSSPTSMAWMRISDMAMDRFIQLHADRTGKSPEEIKKSLPMSSRLKFMSMNLTGWDKRVAQALVEQHAETVASYEQTLKTMRYFLANSNIDPDEGEYLLNIFTLGILVGEKSAEIAAS